MQPSTANTQHDRGSPVPAVPPELLETVARALAAALVPPPRQPDPSEHGQPADFLTAAQLAARLGVSRETVRRLAIAGALPHTVVCRGTRKTTRRYPAAVRRRVRGQRPGRGRPGRLRRRLAGAGHRARTVTARPPRHRTPATPAACRGWRDRAACRGADLDLFFPGRGESAEPARRICAACPVRQPCLDYAISHGITHGIWGGLTERDRRALRSRQRGPPGGSVMRRSRRPPPPGTPRRRSAGRSAWPARR